MTPNPPPSDANVPRSAEIPPAVCVAIPVDLLRRLIGHAELAEATLGELYGEGAERDADATRDDRLLAGWHVALATARSTPITPGALAPRALRVRAARARSVARLRREIAKRRAAMDRDSRMSRDESLDPMSASAAAKRAIEAGRWLARSTPNPVRPVAGAAGRRMAYRAAVAWGVLPDVIRRRESTLERDLATWRR